MFPIEAPVRIDIGEAWHHAHQTRNLINSIILNPTIQNKFIEIECIGPDLTLQEIKFANDTALKVIERDNTR